MKTTLPIVLPCLVLAAVSLATEAARAQDAPSPGFLVVAPDRGFLGNEEMRDAFAPFAEGQVARLVFATDERTRGDLAAALGSLRAAGAREVVVLPAFVAPSSPRLALARRALDELRAEATVRIEWGRPFGASYLAVEALADRLRSAVAAVPAAHGAGHGAGARALVLVTSGARDEASREALQADGRRLATWAAQGLEVASIEVAVAPDFGLDDAEARDRLRQAFEDDLARTATGAVVVPYHQGMKLDGMMSLDAGLARALPRGATLADTAGVTPDPLVGLWLEREANRHLARSADDLGVVVLAHGSDYHWNETLRQAVAPLGERYLLESTFSMADAGLVERSIRALERRGARAAVVVRVFGLASSFRGAVERMLGLEVEGPGGTLAEPPAADPPAGAHGHGGHGPAGSPPRIRTALVTATAGGLEDHPLFARALYDRALEISADPSRETLILTAHGQGDDDANTHWREVLESLATQVRELGGDRFRAVETVTWREDWPSKREPEIERARRLVAEAEADGGRALVVPARTNGEGPARELLAGLDVRTGTGFAPHPLFVEWVQTQVRSAVAAMELGDGAERELRAALGAAGER